VRNYFGPLVYERSVPSSVKFREAYARGVPLVVYDRFSPGASAYRAAASAFLASKIVAGESGERVAGGL
jgi:chromosome partitioning protein